MTEQKAGSILAAMSQGVRAIAQDKAAQAQGLTPVALERGTRGIPETPETFLTNEAVRDIAIDLRRQAAILLDVATGLDALTKVPTDATLTRTPRKADERFAGTDPEPAIADPEGPGPEPEAPETAEFAEKFAAQQKAAQAATFTGGPTVERIIAEAADPERAANGRPGWHCPVHGSEGVTKTSPGGRTYIGCSADGCKKFRKGDA